MTQFVCSNCGYGSASWLGRCPSCNEFNTFKEFDTGEGSKTSRRRESVKKLSVTSLKKVAPLQKKRLPTGMFEVDRVLGGGITPGAVVLLTGEPGVGKSTLLLQALQKLKVLYISGEEGPEQVKERAERLGVDLSQISFSSDLQVEGIASGVESELAGKVDAIVIDSIQTVYSKDEEAAPGNVTQLRTTTAKLINLAKKMRVAIIIVGHVTKEGEIAGPKTVEHMVDTVLSFEGERVSHFRILRSSKNRFGSTDEIGIFEMTQKGLKQVDNPTAFLEGHEENVPGKAIVGVIEGHRPLFFEIQTLASPTMLPMPRRVVRGVDYNKVLLLLAVIRKHIRLPLDKYDIYINVIGGVTIKSPAADLGIVASIISSIRNMPQPPKSVFIGEVGLLGEIRKIVGQERIIAEAKRLTFQNIYSPENARSIREFGSLESEEEQGLE